MPGSGVGLGVGSVVGVGSGVGTGIAVGVAVGVGVNSETSGVVLQDTSEKQNRTDNKTNSTLFRVCMDTPM